MVLRDAGSRSNWPPGYPDLVSGFYEAEQTHRWTCGDALLPEELVAAMPDGFTLELKLVQSGLHYPAPKQAELIPFATRHSAA